MEYKTKMREDVEKQTMDMLRSISEKMKAGIRESKKLSVDSLKGSKLEQRSDGLIALQNSLNTDTLRYLNKENVTGLWVFNDWFYNDKCHPVFLIRSGTQAGTLEWSKLVEEIYSIIPHENAFSYNEDFIGVNIDDTITDRIRSEATAGNLFSIYDAETA